MSQKFIQDQITGLLDRGHAVEIIAEQNAGEPVGHDDVSTYRLPDRTRYLPALPKGKWPRRLETLRLIGLNALSHPIDLFRVLRINLKRPGGFNYVYFAYGLCCLGRRYDVFHAHFGPVGEAGVLLRQAGFGKAAVTTFHGYDVTSYIRQYGPAVYRHLLAECDLYTYNSEKTKTHLEELGAIPERMVKLPMGVNLKGIAYRERQRPTDRPVRILSVGRLVAMKGRRDAIEAVCRLLDRGVNLEYHILGDGPLRQDLQDQIRISGHADRIFLHGWVEDAELDRWYRSSDIFLHPSATAPDGNQEGQGMVLIEAQAHGLLVIATRHGAFPETVPEGTGFLVPEKDPPAIANCLDQLLSAPDLWPETSRKGRDNADRFEMERLNDQLQALYFDLVKQECPE